MKANKNYGCSNSAPLQLHVIEKVRELDCGVDCVGIKLVKRMSDVYLLFHQERLLEKLGVSAIQEWLKTLQNSTPGVDYSGLTDEELLQFVKSRHIQSDSEYDMWLSYLSNQESNLRRTFDAYVLEKKQQSIDQAKARAAREAQTAQQDSNSGATQ